MMKSTERVSATIQGKSTDRRAFCPLLSLYGAKLAGHSLHEHYTSPEAYVRGQSAVLENFQPDVLIGPFSLPKEGGAFGSQYRIFENQAPNLKEPAFATPAAFQKAVLPDINANKELLYFRECVRLLAKTHGDKVPIAAITAGPIDIGAMIFTIENWLNTIMFDEAGTQRVLEKTKLYFVEWANSLLSDGASFLILPAAFTNPRIIPRKQAISVVVPAMKEAFAQVKGPIVIHSAGAALAPFLDLFVGLPNVVGFVLNDGDNFTRARDIAGETPVLMGNIEGPSLFMREKQEIFEDCKALLANRKDDPRFILATSMADIDLQTPAENIKAFSEAIEEFAKEHNHAS